MNEERIAELEAYIEAQSHTIRMATKAREESLGEWAAIVSPWRVGDVTTGQGYAFRGKQCRVTSVRGSFHYDTSLRVRINAIQRDSPEKRRHRKPASHRMVLVSAQAFRAIGQSIGKPSRQRDGQINMNALPRPRCCLPAATKKQARG